MKTSFVIAAFLAFCCVNVYAWPSMKGALDDLTDVGQFKLDPGSVFCSDARKTNVLGLSYFVDVVKGDGVGIYLVDELNKQKLLRGETFTFIRTASHIEAQRAELDDFQMVSATSRGPWSLCVTNTNEDEEVVVDYAFRFLHGFWSTLWVLVLMIIGVVAFVALCIYITCILYRRRDYQAIPQTEEVCIEHHHVIVDLETAQLQGSIN